MGHGLIEEKPETFGETGKALGGEELQNSLEEVWLGWVGHGCVWVVVFARPQPKPPVGRFEWSATTTAKPPRGVVLLVI